MEQKRKFLPNKLMIDQIRNPSHPSPEDITLKLLEYCKSREWAGWDPYDALNSRLFKTFKLLDFKYFRLALTQLLKRSPINLRPLLLVEKGVNPKGIALFLSSAVKLTKIGLLPDDGLVRELTNRLLDQAFRNNDYMGWGYNFDWQTRGVLVSKGSPNIICTTFAGNALLDVYALNGDPHTLEAASRAAHFILEQLYDEINESESCFNYYLQGKSRVHNANLLGAAYLCRVSHNIGDRFFIEPSLKAVRFTLNRQRPDGSWNYGEASSQRWIDNFHTGFNLCALRRIGIEEETTEFDPYIRHGLDFYLHHFFTDEGAPKYFHNRMYPIDIHSIAQSIITLATFIEFESTCEKELLKVFNYVVEHMWDNRGFFLYQIAPIFKNRIPYMRWSQAWMLFSLSVLLFELNKPAYQDKNHTFCCGKTLSV